MEIGKSSVAKTIVSLENTAKAVGSGSLDVFGTPMMIALMEQAAAAAIPEASVGTQISVEHTAASPLGAQITATAVITSVEKRKITFDITARDDKKEIGKGTHTRFIIDPEKFMAKLEN